MYDDTALDSLPFMDPGTVGDPSECTDQKIFICQRQKDLLYKFLVRAPGPARLAAARKLGNVIRAQRLLESTAPRSLLGPPPPKQDPAELARRMAKLEESLAAVIDRLEQMETHREIQRRRIQELMTSEVGMNATTARLRNRERLRMNLKLIPFPATEGPNFGRVPTNFPTEATDVDIMNRSELTSLLNYYDVPFPEGVSDSDAMSTSEIRAWLTRFLCEVSSD